MDIAANTKVFLSAHDPATKQRVWMVSYENKRTDAGLVPWPTWGTVRDARAMTFEYATIVKARFWEIHKQVLRITLQAHDDAQFVDDAPPMPQAKDDRVPMHYRGVIAHPGVDVRTGRRVWHVRIVDPIDSSRQLDSVAGPTPEDAVNRAIELFGSKAEKYVAPEALPPSPAAQKNPGPRLRPVDRK
jgi:hypothetical protein